MAKLSAVRIVGAVLLLCAATTMAQTFTSLTVFHGPNGEFPGLMSLIQGPDGNFYGTTEEGGSSDYGTIFRITPDGELTTLYTFCANFDCTDGIRPFAGLVLGTDGNFYGTTSDGGAHGFGGTVFKITSAGVLTTLHSFNFTDGETPNGLIQGTDGNFYGTTQQGGGSGHGNLFRITPRGEFTTVANFNSSSGGHPLGTLILAADGNLYGTAVSGGLNDCIDGCGTVFKLNSRGTLTTLHSFDGSDGFYPAAGLIQASDGNLYGTTSRGGNGMNSLCHSGRFSGCGTVFKIALTGALTTLYDFCSLPSCADGASPYAGIVQATDGNLYGATFQGGDLTCLGPNGCGMLFQLTMGGVLANMHSFEITDGDQPLGALFQATNGTLYGSANSGGDRACPSNSNTGCGTLFTLGMGLGPFVSFVRNPAKVGQTFGILGYGLIGTTEISVNGTKAHFTVRSDTVITATVPAGATTGYVTVTTPSGTLTSNVPFHVIP